MVFPASLDTADVLKPGKEVLDFSAAAIASERSPVLSAILCAAMLSNHFDADLRFFGKSNLLLTSPVTLTEAVLCAVKPSSPLTLAVIE